MAPTAAPDHDDHHYHPKDTITATVKSTLITTTAGLFASAVQNSLTKHNVGMMGVFTRTGGTVALFGAMGAAYEFTKNVSANLREKDDAWNPATGGFFAGSLMGLRLRTTPAVLGYGSGLAILLYAFNYTGGRLQGRGKDPLVDEVGRKEYLRRNRRRPMEETVEQLGEGRGIYAPGYQERRAQRLKERYGFEVPVSQPASSQ